MRPLDKFDTNTTLYLKEIVKLASKLLFINISSQHLKANIDFAELNSFSFIHNSNLHRINSIRPVNPSSPTSHKSSKKRVLPAPLCRPTAVNQPTSNNWITDSDPRTTMLPKCPLILLDFTNSTAPTSKDVVHFNDRFSPTNRMNFDQRSLDRSDWSIRYTD